MSGSKRLTIFDHQVMGPVDFAATSNLGTILHFTHSLTFLQLANIYEICGRSFSFLLLQN